MRPKEDPTMAARVRILICGIFAATCLWHTSVSFAATALDAVWVSPDITLELAGVVTDDEDVAVDNLLGLVVHEALGTLPEPAEVDAFHLEYGGDRLFSLDVAAELTGAVFAERSDVIRYDGVVYTIEFDASAQGISSGANLDAVSRHHSGDLLLSFDTTQQLGAVVANDEDLVRFDGATYSLHFDGSSEGVTGALDLDGAHIIPWSGELLVSFDGSGSVGGVVFDDEDVLELDGGVWSLSYDGSAEHSTWTPGDVQAVHAVPEPGQLLALASGAALLRLLRRRR
jgi:hypothetical protein